MGLISKLKHVREASQNYDKVVCERDYYLEEYEALGKQLDEHAQACKKHLKDLIDAKATVDSRLNALSDRHKEEMEGVKLGHAADKKALEAEIVHMQDMVAEKEGDIFRLVKEIENLKNQHNATVSVLQEALHSKHQEVKSANGRAERLQTLVSDMNIYRVDPAAVSGRIFSRIAPLIDKDGYEDMLAGKGRMKAKIIEEGRPNRIVYLECSADDE